jgi:hypothetical protein
MRLLIHIPLAAILAAACADKPEADTIAAADSLPPGSYTKSPASLIKKNDDGTSLIKIRPHVYMSEMGCTMMQDDMGNTFSQLYHVISFSLGEANYYAIWGVRFGKGPPLQLNRHREYRFLVRPFRAPDFKDESAPCEIIKIWDRGRLVFEKT